MAIFGKKPAETVVISVGGSLLASDGKLDVNFLKKFYLFIHKQISEHNRRFLLVIGGGSIARLYRDAAKDIIGQITDEDLDWIGIHTTRLNAHLFRTVFKEIAHPRIIENYEKPLRHWNEPVAIGAGWKPGWSTDYCATILARDYKASVIINLSNIDYVFDKDPSRYKDAKKIKKTTWDYFENIVGKKWVPGTNAPFDAVASQLAKRMGIMVIVANGKNISNLNRILNGESFKGTVITNYKIDASYYDRDYFEEQKGEYPLPMTQSVAGKYINDMANMYRAIWIKLFINPRNCLDIGCGTGRLVYFLRKLGIEAYGIEISEYAISAAEKEIQPFLQHADLTKIPFNDDSFDLVLSFDVMEHMERSKIKKSIEESVRVSRKFVLHKIYTIENSWIEWTHAQDFSHISVMSQAFWYDLFKGLGNVSIVKKFVFKLPAFFESLFLLRKKS